MQLLCVARHPYLSEHLCRFFEDYGMDTVPCVGACDAARMAIECDADAVIFDYDLLATISLAAWEQDPALSSVPIIAVSLTRHPDEAHVMDVDAIAAFIYLPTLEPHDARRILDAIRRKRGRAIAPPPDITPWQPTPSIAHRP